MIGRYLPVQLPYPHNPTNKNPDMVNWCVGVGGGGGWGLAAGLSSFFGVQKKFINSSNAGPWLSLVK